MPPKVRVTLIFGFDSFGVGEGHPGFNGHNSLGFKNFVFVKAHRKWQTLSKEKIHPSYQDWSARMITDCRWPPAEAIARSSKTVFELKVAKLGGDEVFQSRRVVLNRPCCGCSLLVAANSMPLLIEFPLQRSVLCALAADCCLQPPSFACEGFATAFSLQ